MTTTGSAALHPQCCDDISKIGLVIQGPLVSRGRTGGTANIKRRNLGEAHVVNYNCIDNIAKLVNCHAGFGKVVCVVWSEETRENLAELTRKIGAEHVVVIEDDSKDVKPKKGIIPGNNKYRQFLSSLKGIEVLAAHGLDYAIKVRSDQDLNLQRLAEDFLRIVEVRSHPIMVPRIYAGSSTDHLADFYIGGRCEDLIACFAAYLDAPELYRNVHTDIFYSWAATMLGAPGYPPRILGLKTNKKYILKAWNQLYCPASFALLEALRWRGEVVTFDRQKNKFLEDLPPSLLVKKDLLERGTS